jgi:uncharacterized protein with HEPN domain
LSTLGKKVHHRLHGVYLSVRGEASAMLTESFPDSHGVLPWHGLRHKKARSAWAFRAFVLQVTILCSEEY